MRALLALAALAPALAIAPAHAVSSCANNPNVLTQAAAGASASCETDDPNAWLVAVTTGAVEIDLACESGPASSDWTFGPYGARYLAPADAQRILGGWWTCTLTMTAIQPDTTAYSTMA